MTGQAYTLTGADDTQDRTGRGVVDGMILISHSWAHVLFDTGASHSFISLLFAQLLGLEISELDYVLTLGTPMGGVADVSSVCKSCRIVINDRKLLADLIVLPMRQYDVILGMDWLSKYRAVVDCHTKRVTLFPSDGHPIVYQAIMSPLEPSPVPKACLGGKKKLKCYGNLFAIDGEERTDDQDPWILVVSEYSEVFPEDLPGLPPDRENGKTACISNIVAMPSLLQIA